ncbi:DUF4864 domain-containing protein [Shimia sp.]|uniref:DUF4864 domain-containing protein n=1 Tax=Shimia sp. TaxID=1954381 RepID=UPI003B8ADAC9
MRHLWRALLLVLALVAGGMVAAQQEDASKGIQSVISAQIEAFRGDDVDQAFRYAADNIQQMFGTAENFGVMVKRGYPMVQRPAEVRFGALRADGDALWQRVLMRDAQGVVHMLAYRMVNDGDNWRISAVYLVPAEEVGA